MNACHVFLQRPWHFDRSVVYNGQNNMYILSLKGIRIVLGPMKEKVEMRIEKGEELVVFITVCRGDIG